MKARTWLTIVLFAPFAFACLALADERKKGEEQENEKVDTEFIFGFTEGADVGDVGENELEHQAVAGLVKRSGHYTAINDNLRYEHVPFENFRFEFGGVLGYHSISGVAGLDDRSEVNFNGLVTQLRYRLLDREHAPFALTVGVEPHWSRLDETSGESVQNYGGDIVVALDKEFIKDKLFAALNFVYDPEVTRLRDSGLIQRESTLGAFASATVQWQPGIFAGVEARYLCAYDGLTPQSFAGEALFVGPTMFIRFTKTFAISGSWGAQLAGHAVRNPGTLDLTNLTRQQATLRVEYNF